MERAEIPRELRDDLRAGWQRFVDRTAPLRPILHGYCLRLTRDLWDAEDLVQETLVRGFAALGSLGHDVDNPRAYLLRIATNAWIDVRRRGERDEEARRLESEIAVGAAPTGELPDAAARLLELAPRERAAVLLTDVFDLPLAEVADVLATTTGAVKAALHRGRGRLRDEEISPRPRTGPSAELLERFLDAFRRSDVQALLDLVLDNASVENVGCGLEVGAEGAKRDFEFLRRVVEGHDEWPPEMQYDSARAEVRTFAGERILAWLVTRRGREALEQVFRFDEQDGKIARLRGYAFCPETMRVLGDALGCRVRTGLYRYPTPAPGEFY